MTDSPPTLPDSVLAALRGLDTPTVCNALEAVVPERRGHGYTVRHLHALTPDHPPMVGYARTARIAAMHPPEDPKASGALSREYYGYVAEGGPQPSVMIIEDVDPIPGYGAWWGEVNTNLHKGLGSLGLVTNGSVRDLDDVAQGFSLLAGVVAPSHAYVHVVDFGGVVEVHGMQVASGDLIHADRHGAVVVPHDAAEKLPEAAAEIAARERVLIDASQREGFDYAALQRTWRGEVDH